MPKFVQTVKLMAFEKLFKADARVRQRTSGLLRGAGWADDYDEKRANGSVADLRDYFSRFPPRLLVKSHEQCILFTHLLFNESLFAPRAANNIFAFIYEAEAANTAPLAKLNAATPPTGAVANFLLQARAAFNLDPLFFLLLSSSRFPLARYYFQFSGSGGELLFSI